jgi:hypothetical protein
MKPLKLAMSFAFCIAITWLFILATYPTPTTRTCGTTQLDSVFLK